MENHTFEQTKKDVSAKTSSKLREMLKNSDFMNRDASVNRGDMSARARINRLLDEGTFVEIGAYVKSADENCYFSGVICGYGAIDGRLVYVFSQDYDRANVEIDDFYTKKLLTLYDMALKNGAPIVAILDGSSIMASGGESSVSSLADLGKIIKAVNSASGIIPQIAVIVGECDGTFASVASMFDFVINGFMCSSI